MAKYRYFSPVVGRAAPRYGTGAFIGAIKGPTGFVWDESEVVPIPISEIRIHLKAYGKLLRKGPRLGPSLIERTRADYELYSTTRGFEPVPDDPQSPMMVDSVSAISGKPSKKDDKKPPKKSAYLISDKEQDGGGEK
jgi:hypothetical protein